VRYVKPSFLPVLLATGAVLVVIAGVTLWRQIRTAPEAVAEPPEVDYRERAIAAGRAAAAHEGLPSHGGVDDDVDEEHAEHRHDDVRVGWFLVAPALALLLFSPPALGSYQANRNGTALAVASGSDYAPLPAGDPVSIKLLDYAGRAVFDDGRSLAGRDVRLTGFILAGPGGVPYLARLFVGCCAADARPIKVGLTGDLPGILNPDQWVEVVGRYVSQADRDPINGEVVPYLFVTSIREIPPPAEPYET
jgi:uncharacterized repeat protein (TIGR03943 family)